jgi:hypothetical protein
LKKLTVDNITLRQAQQIIAMEERAAGIRSDRHEAILVGNKICSMPYYKYVHLKNGLFAIIEADVTKPPVVRRLQTASRLYDIVSDLDHLTDVMSESQFELLSACFAKDYLFNLNSILAMMAYPVFKSEDVKQLTLDQVGEDILQAKFIDCWNAGANFIYSTIIEIPFEQKIQNLRMKLKLKPRPAELIEKDGAMVCITNE